jgi:hypothetical protein
MMEASCNCAFKEFSASDDITSGENSKMKSGLVLTPFCTI